MKSYTLLDGTRVSTARHNGRMVVINEKQVNEGQMTLKEFHSLGGILGIFHRPAQHGDGAFKFFTYKDAYPFMVERLDYSI